MNWHDRIDAMPWFIALPFLLGLWLLLLAACLAAIVASEWIRQAINRRRTIEQLTHDTIPWDRYVPTLPRRRRAHQRNEP